MEQQTVMNSSENSAISTIIMACEHDDVMASSKQIAWDDGHIPENLQNQQQQYLRIYPEYHERRGAVVHCIDDAAAPQLANAVYNFTTTSNSSQQSLPPTWGSYVTMDQIREHWKEERETITTNYENLSQEDLALHAAASFIRNALNADSTSSKTMMVQQQQQQQQSSTTTCDDQHQQQQQQGAASPLLPLWTERDCELAHGVAVWTLASTVGSQVPYHLDYAELLRYETGVIVPPVLAGTWHVTNSTNNNEQAATVIKGGCYCVNTAGLEHYKTHGYKGALKSIRMDDDNNWISIPYKYNRMICQSGHLPHLSTKVESMISGATKRVIVGFNVFLKDFGGHIQQAPEHSDAFRRRVRQKTSNAKPKVLVLSNVLANPKLSKMLVLAKREKIKQEFGKAQEQLDQRIQTYLKAQDGPITVQQLLDYLNTSSSLSLTTSACYWPRNVNDLHVHIHHRWKEGRLAVNASPAGCDDDESNSSDPSRTVLVNVRWLVQLPS